MASLFKSLARLDRSRKATKTRRAGTGSNRVVIVLGMHRSGTSCLTGTLERHGLYLGEVNRKAPANLRGNHENRAIMDLHEAVLASNDASWDRPKTGLIWSPQQLEELDRRIEAYPRDRTWGFKDPRTLLVLDRWLETVSEPSLIGSFRHPLAVASSLEKRNRFPVARSLELWEFYNRELLAAWQNEPFPLINFDLPERAYHQNVAAACGWLGLSRDRQGDSFFTESLRTSDRSSRSLPRATRELYDQLLRASEQASEQAGEQTGQQSIERP